MTVEPIIFRRQKLLPLVAVVGALASVSAGSYAEGNASCNRSGGDKTTTEYGVGASGVGEDAVTVGAASGAAGPSTTARGGENCAADAGSAIATSYRETKSPARSAGGRTELIKNAVGGRAGAQYSW